MEFFHRNALHDQSKFQGLDQVVNITDWDKGTAYSEGARDKFEAFCPEEAPYPFLIPRHRYMFKQSDRKYSGDFLVEILAYRVGVRMGVPVAPVFVAIDDTKKIAGALSEWFYSYPGSEAEMFLMGGDVMQNVIENYDRDKGTQHNLTDIIEIFSDTSDSRFIAENFKENGMKTLIFDAFIGNGDRHQDNWGLVACARLFLSPAFDNGSAMGHEILEHKLSGKSVEDYINKGCHHLKIRRDDKKKAGHLALIRHVLSLFPEAQGILRECLNFDVNLLKNDLMLLREMQDSLPYNDNWLTEARMEFMQRLFVRRYELLKDMTG